MAFDFRHYYKKGAPESGALKIYWLLSEYSINVIQSDMHNFEYLLKSQSINTVSRMYNYVFKMYYKYARCSFVKDTFDFFDNKGIKQNYRFSDKTVKILRNHNNNENDNVDMDRIAEIFNETNAGEYFRAVLEEYAHLPIYEREKYLNIGVYDKLSKHITEHTDFSKRKLLKIDTYTSDYNTYIAYPYKLMPCKNLNHYYLVALSKEADKEKSFEIYPIRLTHILSVEPDNSYQEGLTADKLKDMAEYIDERLKIVDVPYIREFCYGKDVRKDKNIDEGIRVKFSKNGIGLLHRIIHNRPEHTEPDEDNICIFKCTKTEIVNYLHNFGKDAEVLYPPEIRKALKDFYCAAAKTYSKEVSSKDDYK